MIRHGNERVLRARFNDARFFWEFDQRVSLEERTALLEKVTFQKDLGSYAAKTERVRRVASALARRVLEVDARALDEAARLAKTDLTAELVKEFTELQGVVGGLYARAQGVSEAAAAAIYDQYRPVGMEDRVPRTVEGSLLAMADKADTIAGMFGLGMEPTGSKDPFALRRAANGIVKILAESTLPLTLQDVAEAGAEGKGELVGAMLGFFRERVEFYLREVKGQAYDVVAAVLAAGFAEVRDAVARAEAVTAVRVASGVGGDDFAAVSAAFKRMGNILAQAREKGIEVPAAGGGESAAGAGGDGAGGAGGRPGRAGGCDAGGGRVRRRAASDCGSAAAGGCVLRGRDGDGAGAAGAGEPAGAVGAGGGGFFADCRLLGDCDGGVAARSAVWREGAMGGDAAAWCSKGRGALWRVHGAWRSRGARSCGVSGGRCRTRISGRLRRDRWPWWARRWAGV